MSSNYKINVNKQFEFDINKDSITNLNIVTINNHKYHLLDNNLSYSTELITSNFDQKEYTIKVNNNKYQVKISDALDLLIKELGFEVSKSKQINSIKAPMPGLILEINVTIGQTVKEGDSLLILTAMKMENDFLSPREGTIKSITVNSGDTVVKGDLLIEFES